MSGDAMNLTTHTVVHTDGSATVGLFGAELYATPEFFRKSFIVRKSFRSFALNNRDGAPTYRVVSRVFPPDVHRPAVLCRRLV